MKLFVLKSLIFFSILYVISLGLSYSIDLGLKKSDDDSFKVLNTIYRGNLNLDLVVQGSSKAFVQISPQILDTVLKLNSYNFGMNGHHFIMENARFEFFLKHNRKPQYIIQVVDYATLSKRIDLYEKEQFLPYYNDSILHAAIKQYEGYYWYENLIPLSKYWSKVKLVNEGLKLEFAHSSKQTKTLLYKGYQANDKPWDYSFDEFKKEYPHGLKQIVHEPSVACFDKFLQKTKKSNINVILVYTPEYYESPDYITNLDSIKNIYTSLARKYNLTYLDYSLDSICLQKKYFYNSQHLNKNGAELFTIKLARDLIAQKIIE
jgi:hypothetical protein